MDSPISQLLAPPVTPDTQEKHRPFQFYTAQQYANERPAKTWLIDGILGPKDICLAYGPSGCGKTFAILDLCFAACLGQPVWERHETKRELRILYCTGEGGDGLGQRINALAEKYEGIPYGLSVVGDVPQLCTPGGQSLTEFRKQIDDMIECEEISTPHIIIIDTLSTAIFGGNDNDNSQMADALHRLDDQLCKPFNCGIILVHHAGKSGEGYRGASSLKANVFSAVGFQLDDNGNGIVTCDKLKDGAAWMPGSYKLQPVGDSVVCEWTGTAPVKRPLRDSLLSAVASEGGKMGTVKTLCGMAELDYADNKSNATNQLNKLVGLGFVSRQLQYPDRVPSNSNPTMYWMNSAQLSNWQATQSAR